MSHASRLAIVVVMIGAAAWGQESRRRDARVERGRYLTERVAMCIQCHTPRDDKGQLLESERFRGAPIPVRRPPEFPREWAIRAPTIAGLPEYTDAQAMRLLTEGIARTGAPPSPPMPPFRFEKADAEAVIAYLRSLK